MYENNNNVAEMQQPTLETFENRDLHVTIDREPDKQKTDDKPFITFDGALKICYPLHSFEKESK